MPRRFHGSPRDRDTYLPGISGNLPSVGTEFFQAASDNLDMIQKMALFLLALRDTRIIKQNSNVSQVLARIDGTWPSRELNSFTPAEDQKSPPKNLICLSTVQSLSSHQNDSWA